MSSDTDEFFGKTLSVHDPADNEPCDEAFVRELLPETKRNQHRYSEGSYRLKYGRVGWRGFPNEVEILVSGQFFKPSDFTRRQFRNLVNAMKGEEP